MSEEDSLAISEMFYSIQGEGRYVGRPSVFVRKSYCNLRCGGWHNDDIEKQEDMHPSEDASWVCDSIEVFQNPELEGSRYDVRVAMVERGLVEPLQNGAHLILTGGEPTMPQSQQSLSQLVHELNNPFTEVETNGTIVPDWLVDVVDQWNVSPKLSNSGMEEERRINPDALQWHSDNDSSDFKFVVSSENDMDEIWDLLSRFGVKHDDVWLMPSGANREQIQETAPRVAELCKEYDFNFSPRLQVNVWNEATGV